MKTSITTTRPDDTGGPRSQGGKSNSTHKRADGTVSEVHESMAQIKAIKVM